MKNRIRNRARRPRRAFLTDTCRPPGACAPGAPDQRAVDVANATFELMVTAAASRKALELQTASVHAMAGAVVARLLSAGEDGPVYAREWLDASRLYRETIVGLANVPRGEEFAPGLRAASDRLLAEIERVDVSARAVLSGFTHA